MSAAARGYRTLAIGLTVAGLASLPAPAIAARRVAADTTPPTVAISAPTAGATVSGSFTVTGTASDNKSVTKVEVAVDSGAFSLASGTTSWSLGLTSGGYPNGSHTLTARATDSSGNVSSAAVTVSVSNAVADTTAPTVSIASPAAASTVSGVVSVSGAAADNTSVASVQVQVDSGAWQAASGTTSWSTSLDTTGYAPGSHTLTARATDMAGNASTTTSSFSVASATTTTNGPDIRLVDPKATHPLALLGRGRMAHLGSLTALLYGEQFTSRIAVFLRDTGTGASSYVDLPTNNPNGWQNTYLTLTSPSDLWALGGTGPVYLRHYTLTGSPVATAAALVSEQALGDADSRSGDLITLASGGLVAVWHQQGISGPEGIFLVYRSPAGTWTTLPELTFMSTASSKQILVQHPADGSVWLFNDPDAWASTGAVHLTESPAGLAVDWTNDRYLSRDALGPVGPSGENPDLAVAADPQAGTIDLAFESDDYRYFSTNPIVKGAYVSVARIPAAGSFSFVVLPTYVERITQLSLSVVGGSMWLGYRPVDPTTLTWDHLYASRYSNGAWGAAVPLGQMSTSYQPLTYTSNAPYVAGKMADGAIHLRTTS